LTSFQNLEFLNSYKRSRKFNLKTINENINENKKFKDISFKIENKNWKNKSN
jgi:hypothetical protein